MVGIVEQVVLRYYKGSWRAIGFYMANTDISGDISLYVRSVDEIEEMTGMDIHYRFKIDRWAIRLFAIIMIPNIIWSLTAGPQDTLMVESRTPVCDIIGSIFQVLMLASLILLQRENRPSPMWIPSTHQLTNGMRLINS